MLKKSSRIPSFVRRGGVVAAALGCASLLVATASASAARPASASASASATPVTITWWTWTANPQNVIANFEKAYPYITVEPPPSYGAGNPFIAKLEAALGTGTGPDVTQISDPNLPHFILSKDLLNIGSYDNQYKKDFPAAVWDEVSEGSALYAIPEDIGPAGFAYRPNIMAKYHLEIPTTWSEYAADAVKLHKEDPKMYFGYFPINDGSYDEALLSQTSTTEAKPLSGGAYQLDYDSTAEEAVIAFWGKLVKEHAILAVDDYTPAWEQQVASGEFATYMAPAWAPAYEIDGYLSPKVEQTFKVTAMPQFSAGQNVAANWGGSVNAVTKDAASNVLAASALFAAYINTSKSGLAIDEKPNTATGGGRGLFPASVERNQVPEFNVPAPHFLGDVNKQFGQYANDMSPQFNWSPWDAEFESYLTTELGSADAGKMSWSSVLPATEQQLLSYVRDAGYTVQS